MELLFIPEVCSPKCWEKFSAALSLYMQPEQCQQSRCGSVGTGYGPFLLSPVLVQLLGLQTGNKGVGQLGCRGELGKPAELPEEIRSILKIRFYQNV